MVGFSNVNAPEFSGVPLRPKLILLVTSLFKVEIFSLIKNKLGEKGENNCWTLVEELLFHKATGSQIINSSELL